MNKFIGVLFFICLLFVRCTNSERKDSQVSILKNSNGDSLQITYFYNGNKKSEAILKNDQINGLYIAYYENGSIKETGLMENNHKLNIWKSFDSAGTLKNVRHYYMDTVVYELPPVDFIFEERSSKETSFSIKVPKYWGSQLENPSLLFMAYKPDSTFFFTPNITITKDSANVESLEQHVSSTKNILSGNLSNLKIFTERVLLINTKDAYQMGFRFDQKDKNIGALLTIIKDNTTYYNITEMAGNEPPGSFLKYKGLFEEVANSFKLAKQ